MVAFVVCEDLAGETEGEDDEPPPRKLRCIFRMLAALSAEWLASHPVAPGQVLHVVAGGTAGGFEGRGIGPWRARPCVVSPRLSSGLSTKPSPRV